MLTLNFSVVDLQEVRLENGFDLRTLRAKVITNHVPQCQQDFFDFGDLSCPL